MPLLNDDQVQSFFEVQNREAGFLKSAFRSDPIRFAFEGRQAKSFVSLKAESVRIASVQDNGFSLAKTIAKRKSCRSFSERPLFWKDFSAAVSLSFGTHAKEDRSIGRSYPSAGALYPTELYIANIRMSDKEPGIYRYSSDLDLFEKMSPLDLSQLYHCSPTFEESAFRTSSAAVFFIGRFQDLLLKYGPRGWKFVFMDAGSALTVFSLAAEDNDFGVWPCGAPFDAPVSRLLQLDLQSQTVMLMALVGRKKESL